MFHKHSQFTCLRQFPAPRFTLFYAFDAGVMRTITLALRLIKENSKVL